MFSISCQIILLDAHQFIALTGSYLTFVVAWLVLEQAAVTTECGVVGWHLAYDIHRSHLLSLRDFLRSCLISEDGLIALELDLRVVIFLQVSVTS